MQSSPSDRRSAEERHTRGCVPPGNCRLLPPRGTCHEQSSTPEADPHKVDKVSDATAPKLAARLELPRPVAGPGGPLEYTVINIGDLPIRLGAHYSLECDAGDGWQPVETSAGFRAWGRRLLPGNRTQITAYLPQDLPAGRYRLRKRLNADADPHPGYEWIAHAEIPPIETTAEFRVDTDHD